MRTLALAVLMVSSLALAAPKKRHPPLKRPPASAPTPPPSPPPNEGAAPASESAPAASESAPATSESAPPPPSTPAPMTTPEPSGGKTVDLDGLNNEYNQLRDELFRARAKAHLLGDALFKTKIVATFQYKAQRAWPLKKVTLKIDDQPVFTVDAPATADPLKLYDGFAAPGRHTLAVRVECGATGEERVAYGAEGNFVVDVAENKQTNVAFVVDESGDGPAKLARKREGTFDVRVRADIETVERSK